jgi:chromosomal replication initiator protein
MTQLSASLPHPASPGGTHSESTLWAECLEKLGQELPEQQFSTWIRPLRAEASADGVRLLIYVSNRFKLDWVRAQYGTRIGAVVNRVYGRSLVIDWSVSQRQERKNSSTDGLQTAPVAAQATALTASPVEVESDIPSGLVKNRLNSALTFDTLVEGQANRMARTAAMHVAGTPGKMYNPLFIYGGVGLGKTHLMHAVGNRLLADRPQSKVLYIHAEQFVSDVVKSYQRKTFDQFKEKYHSLDLLLIDDVQFFANKDRTQEEFFNAFEALLAKRSHIVMTSDTYPRAWWIFPSGSCRASTLGSPWRWSRPNSRCGWRS